MRELWELLREAEASPNGIVRDNSTDFDDLLIAKSYDR